MWFITLKKKSSPPQKFMTNPASVNIIPCWRERTSLLDNLPTIHQQLQITNSRRETFSYVIPGRRKRTLFKKCVSQTLMPSVNRKSHHRSLFRCCKRIIRRSIWISISSNFFTSPPFFVGGWPPWCRGRGYA